MGFEAVSFLDPAGTTKRYDAAVRVRTKVTPYANSVGLIARGESPEWWTGEPSQFPRSVRNAYTPAADSRAKYCLGSRAVYRDGRQIAVNYLLVGDPILGGGGLFYWHQLDLETDAMGSRLLVLPDDFGDYAYDADLDTHTRANNFEDFWNPFSAFYSGYDSPDTPDNATWGQMRLFKVTNDTSANSQPPYRSRPGAYQSGLRYLSFSGYCNSDSVGEEARYGCVRYDAQFDGDPANAWYAVTSTIWDTSIRYALVRPSIRCHLREGIADDEPWWIAYDRQTNRLGTGRWRARNGESLDAEIENVIPLPSGAQPGPNVLCYNRLADGRDLILIRDAATIYPGGAGGARSTVHWLYDGSNWQPVEECSFATADHDGNLLIGRRRLIKKLGGGGWEHEGNGEFGTVNGGPPVLPEQPEDDADATPPLYNSPSEDFFFQIMVSKSRIHVRDFYGEPGLATSPLTSAEWPDYVVANRANSRDTQAIAADLFKCWTISYDGSVRVPHVQEHAPYTNGDPRRRIHQRMYVGHNPTESQLIFDGVEDREWPKWEYSNFPADWDSGMERFRPWLVDYGNPLGGIANDTFFSHAYNFDFDIVDDCQCCCEGGTVSY